MSFEVYGKRTWRYYVSYVKRFREDVRDVFDMGCGFGLFMEACTHLGKCASGCDFDVHEVKICRSKGLAVTQHDLRRPLDFIPDARFDAVYCGQLIEHMDSDAQRNIISEAHRVLRPGGQFQVCSPCRHYEPARAVEGHINLLTPSELKALVEEAGFENPNMGYNFPQSLPEIPPEELKRIWATYYPDLLSQTAEILTTKPYPQQADANGTDNAPTHPGCS